MKSQAQAWRCLTCASLLVAITAVLALVIAVTIGLPQRGSSADETLVAGALQTSTALQGAIGATLTWAAEWGANDSTRAEADAAPLSDAAEAAQQRTASAATQARLILGVEQTHVARSIATPTADQPGALVPAMPAPSATLPMLLTVTPTPEPGVERIRPPASPFYARALNRLRGRAEAVRAR